MISTEIKTLDEKGAIPSSRTLSHPEKIRHQRKHYRRRLGFGGASADRSCRGGCDSETMSLSMPVQEIVMLRALVSWFPGHVHMPSSNINVFQCGSAVDVHRLGPATRMI